ncbi:MAG: ABC transporter substrate-binding protein [Planctomycetota bacterium]|nr:MAG: ABC transporter substrate-binding protein [Planctomycetota bacterium]
MMTQVMRMTASSWIFSISQIKTLGPCCVALFLVLCFSAYGTTAEDPATESSTAPHVQVGTRHAPPFSYRDDQGAWRGLSITLLNRLAEELDFTFELHERTDMHTLLAETASGQMDMAVAAITITPDRERRLDFSHPFHFTGLGIAVPYHDQQASWLVVLRSLLSPGFLSVVLTLSVVLFITGAFLWIAERRHNPQFPSQPAAGLGSGFWWSAVTMTTVGYGDKAPITLAGRMIALVWMFAALIMIASFTAQITSSLTLSAFHARISGPEDLQRVRVGIVGNTTADHYAKDHNLRRYEFASLRQALRELEAGSVDAVIHDHPLLSYEVQQLSDDPLMVLERTFERQDYGIALPLESPWRKDINPVLIEIVTDPMWVRDLQGYGLR